MLNPSNRPPRTALTAPIFLFALVDMFGLACVGIGASWFATGKGAILTNFPTSTVEAVACTAGGLAVMLWAIARILRELAKQSPEMQAKFNAYVGAQPPDKIRKSSGGEAD
jgi:hypothetical protein